MVKQSGKSRQSIPEKEVKILFAMSGGICAFPECNKKLIQPGTPAEGPVVIGEMAHIVADSRQGPRGISTMSDEERNKHANLILLCPEHHKTIDDLKTTYSVGVLAQMKRDHDLRVEKATSPEVSPAKPQCKKDDLYSTLLPVTHLPSVVFQAPCSIQNATYEEIKKLIVYANCKGQLVPFYFTGTQILAFHDLRDPGGPFAAVSDTQKVDLLNSVDLWKDPDGQRKYVALLNRAMHKHLGRMNVRFEPEHRRYYFAASEAGKERRVPSRTLSGQTKDKLVVWCPKRRKTGESRNFWWHYAAGLRFHQVAPSGWCLSVRPERHITKDGEAPFPTEWVGRKVTRLKAKMYNGPYLAEVHFWRQVLSKGQPRIILNFGSQSAVIEAKFIKFAIMWPGIPEDEKKVRNEEGEEDLFTLADLEEALSGEGLEVDELEDEFEDDGVESDE